VSDVVRKYVRHIHVKMSDETFNKAKALAEQCCEGRIGMLIRKLIEERYEEVFGKKSGGA
jgi:predicted RNA-binding protein with RPS1 domain